MKKKILLLTAVSVLAVLGLTSCSSVSKNATLNANIPTPANASAHFALYSASERLLSLSNDGILGTGKILDTGVYGTTGSWKIMPTISDTLVCVEVDGPANSVYPVFALWKFNAGAPLSKGSYAFSPYGATSCEVASKSLKPYDAAKVSLKKSFSFIGLNQGALSAKGKASYISFVNKGDFLTRIGAADSATLSSLSAIQKIMNTNAKTHIIPDYTVSWKDTATRVLDSNKKVAYTIPAGGYGDSSLINKEYCISYQGWMIANTYLAPQRGECSVVGHQNLVNTDAQALLNAMNDLIPPQSRGAYASGSVAFAKGVLTVYPLDLKHKELIVSKKVSIHATSSVPIPGAIGPNGLWCVEVHNGNTLSVFNASLVLGNQYECQPETLNTPVSKPAK